MTKKFNKLKGFARYVQTEQSLITELELHKNNLYDHESNNSRSKKYEESKVMFFEKPGAVCLYSILQVQDLYSNARRIFGDDRERIAKEILANLATKSNRRNLAGSPSVESIRQLKTDFPNFYEAIEQIEFAAALSNLSNKSWFQMPPLLLLGPAGVGKTAFAQEFANILGIYFKRIDAGMATTGSVLSGLSLGWGSGHTGDIFKSISESEVANPLLMLDEIDKIGRQSSYPIEPTLLALLEKESAGDFKDEAIQLHLNCKHFLWIATANDEHLISEPLKSRFTIVNIRRPNREETKPIVHSIYRKIKANNPWGSAFKNELDNTVADELLDFSPRELTRIMSTAFGKAAVRGGREVKLSDFLLPNKVATRQIGFV